MARIECEELLGEVMRQTGGSMEEARRIVHATFSALATELPTCDLPAMMRCIPRELIPALRVSHLRGTFFERIAEEERIPLGRAIEHGEIVLRALGQLTDAEILMRMTKHLPPDVATHLARRAATDPPPRPPISRETRATGRAGSRHPDRLSREG